MRFTFFPLDTTTLTRLGNLARTTKNAVSLLAELLAAPKADRADLLSQLLHLESDASDLHYSVLTSMKSSFVTPIPREDLHRLSTTLSDTVEDIVTVGERIAHADVTRFAFVAADQIQILARQAELAVEAVVLLSRPTDENDQWMEMVRLSKRAQRAHTVALDQIYAQSKGVRKQRNIDLAQALLAVARDFRSVAVTLDAVVLKES